MTITTQVLGTSLVTLSLLGGALWANGIPPAPRVLACLDPIASEQTTRPAAERRPRSAPVESRVATPTESAPACTDGTQR